MHRVALLTLSVVFLVIAFPTPVGGTSASPTLVAAYPNPVAEGDAGEFVVVSIPATDSRSNLTLSDGETTVSIPHVPDRRQFVVSTRPNLTRRLRDQRVVAFPDDIALTNGGERLRLSSEGTVVDTLQYRDAPEGEVVRQDTHDRWRPLGATKRPVVTADSGRVTAFVLPDAPRRPLELLAGADDRILLAGYTLTSDRVADALVAATTRNVSVRVLVDDAPVGGMTRRQAAVLDRLARAGVEVRLSGGERARYDFHHAKYAVVDDRAVVMTENWKPAGVGGNGSRGWGVVTNQSRIVRGLRATFRADASWHDARRWTAVRASMQFSSGTRANGSYRRRFEPRRLPVERTRLLVTPDNAERELLSLIAGANRSIAIEQVSIGGRRQPFVRATLEAARRGVRVRVLLSGAWYVREENERLVDWLNERAAAENLSLQARIAEPRGRYEKIHAKGVIIDGDQVVVGSLNWNNNSARENREVVLVLSGEAVGTYYHRVFDADWRHSASRLLGGLVAVLALIVGVAMVRASRIQFEREERS